MNRKQRSIDKLTRFLASGRHPMNDRLPPERELAPLLGLSRSALREGLEQLEAEGKIWRRVGKGTFVGGRSPDGGVDLRDLSISTSPSEVMEVRELIEPLVARLAATRATAGEIGQMQHLLEKADSARQTRTWELWDIALHRTIALSAHNTLLLAIFDAFNAMRGLPEWARLRASSLTPERVELYRRHHWAVVDAIVQRSPTLAEEAMRIHIEAVKGNLLGRATQVK
jgi:DNA-binding FadR family transcriptional regulator